MSDSHSCPILCDPMNYTVHGILQAKILEWVVFPFSRRSSQLKDQTQVSCITGRLFYQLNHQESRGRGLLLFVPVLNHGCQSCFCQYSCSTLNFHPPLQACTSEASLSLSLPHCNSKLLCHSEIVSEDFDLVILIHLLC